MQDIQKSFERVHNQFRLVCRLHKDSLNFQIISKDADNYFYYTYITKDAFPENLKVVFETIEQVYQYIEAPTPEKCYEVESGTKLNLLVPILRNIRSIPIYLTEKKELTNEMKLQRKVDALEREVSRLRIIQQESKNKGGESSEMRQQKLRMMRQIDLLQQNLQEARRNEERMSYEMKRQMTQMQVENCDLKAKVSELTAQISSLQMIAEETEQQLNKSRILIKAMTGQEVPEV